MAQPPFLSLLRQRFHTFGCICIIAAVYAFALQGMISTAHALEANQSEICLSQHDDQNSPEHHQSQHHDCLCPALCHNAALGLTLINSTYVSPARRALGLITPPRAQNTPVNPIIAAHPIRGPPIARM
jgi:hypothetical protein